MIAAVVVGLTAAASVGLIAGITLYDWQLAGALDTIEAQRDSLGREVAELMDQTRDYFRGPGLLMRRWWQDAGP